MLHGLLSLRAHVIFIVLNFFNHGLVMNVSKETGKLHDLVSDIYGMLQKCEMKYRNIKGSSLFNFLIAD